MNEGIFATDPETCYQMVKERLQVYLENQGVELDTYVLFDGQEYTTILAMGRLGLIASDHFYFYVPVMEIIKKYASTLFTYGYLLLSDLLPELTEMIHKKIYDQSKSNVEDTIFIPPGYHLQLVDPQGRVKSLIPSPEGEIKSRTILKMQSLPDDLLVEIGKRLTPRELANLSKAYPLPSKVIERYLQARYQEDLAEPEYISWEDVDVEDEPPTEITLRPGDSWEDVLREGFFAADAGTCYQELKEQLQVYLENQGVKLEEYVLYNENGNEYTMVLALGRLGLIASDDNSYFCFPVMEILKEHSSDLFTYGYLLIRDVLEELNDMVQKNTIRKVDIYRSSRYGVVHPLSIPPGYQLQLVDTYGNVHLQRRNKRHFWFPQ